MTRDVILIGGGPAGLAAALALGRARRRILLCDAGERRNAAAEEMHNFVTRDGTPPDEFRRVARAQLAAYPSVEVRDVRVEAIAGTRGAFRVDAGGETIEARRLLLCTGLVDEMLPIEGFAALWGRSIFACPYCHGWEARDRPWGILAPDPTTPHLLPFALQARCWSPAVTVFTHGAAGVPAEVRARFDAAGIRLETAPIVRLDAPAGGLEAVVLEGGRSVACAALFAHPPQRQIPLVRSLDLALDENGFVRVDARFETSAPGIFAAGDLTSRLQAAIVAAAQGMQAAASVNVDLALED